MRSLRRSGGKNHDPILADEVRTRRIWLARSGARWRRDLGRGAQCAGLEQPESHARGRSGAVLPFAHRAGGRRDHAGERTRLSRPQGRERALGRGEGAAGRAAEARGVAQGDQGESEAGRYGDPAPVAPVGRWRTMRRMEGNPAPRGERVFLTCVSSPKASLPVLPGEGAISWVNSRTRPQAPQMIWPARSRKASALPPTTPNSKPKAKRSSSRARPRSLPATSRVHSATRCDLLIQPR